MQLTIHNVKTKLTLPRGTWRWYSVYKEMPKAQNRSHSVTRYVHQAGFKLMEMHLALALKACATMPDSAGCSLEASQLHVDGRSLSFNIQ